MPVRTEVREGLVWTEFEGHVTPDELRALGSRVARLEAGLSFMPGHLGDLTGATSFPPSFGGVSEFARTRRATVFPNGFRSAIVAANEAQLGYARMFQILNDHPMITMAIFGDVPAALAWLRAGGDDVAVIALDPADPAVAAETHAVMQASYRVEAERLGVTAFHPLGRTAEQVRTAPCTFHGVRDRGRLLAVVEVDEHSAERPNVDALVVHPDAFRRGFGTALMRHVMTRYGARGLTVSTGARNAPAIALYERLGFALERRWCTDDGIAMVTMALAPRG